MKNLIFSEQRSSIVKALFEATKEISAIKKGSFNPHTKSNYADIGEVTAAVEAELFKNNILMMQPVTTEFIGDTGYIDIETILIHAPSGEQAVNVLRLPLLDSKSQTIGSAETYGRRYALLGIFTLHSKDDDGNASSGRTEPERKQESQRTKETPKQSNKPSEIKESTSKEASASPSQVEEDRQAIMAMGASEDHLKTFAKAVCRPARMKPEEYAPQFAELRRLMTNSKTVIDEFIKDPETFAHRIRRRVPAPSTLVTLNTLAKQGEWNSGLSSYQTLMNMISPEMPPDGDIIDFLAAVVANPAVYKELEESKKHGGTLMDWIKKYRESSNSANV